jgi:hypothetical protein
VSALPKGRPIYLPFRRVDEFSGSSAFNLTVSRMDPTAYQAAHIPARRTTHKQKVFQFPLFSPKI